MTVTSYPFDAGAGAAVTEDQWAAMSKNWLTNGVIRTGGSGSGTSGAFSVSGNGSGMNVFVEAGDAWIEGMFAHNDAQVTVAIPSNSSGNIRKDLIVLRLDRAGNAITLERLPGTPSVTPVDPTPTQTSATWELPLARVIVDNNATNIAANKVQMLRRYASSYGMGSWIDYNLGTGTSGQLTPISGPVPNVNVIGFSHYMLNGHTCIYRGSLIYNCPSGTTGHDVGLKMPFPAEWGGAIGSAHVENGAGLMTTVNSNSFAFGLASMSKYDVSNLQIGGGLVNMRWWIEYEASLF